MSAIRFGFDETEAVIIGDHYKTGALFYDGRQQGDNFIGDDDETLREKAREQKQMLRERYGAQEFAHLYKDDSKWELRIWD